MPCATHEPTLLPPSPTEKIQVDPAVQGEDALHSDPEVPIPTHVGVAPPEQLSPTPQGVEPLQVSPSFAGGFVEHRPHAPGLVDVTRQYADVHCASSMQALPPASAPGCVAHAAIAVFDV